MLIKKLVNIIKFERPWRSVANQSWYRETDSKLTVFSWICSYIRGSVSAPRPWSSSAYKDCFSGVPQGSVLGPLFSVYVSPIGCVVSDHGISLQQYADDTHMQLHISVSTDDLTVQLSALESCLHSLHSWLCHNGLALNSSKSESILLGTSSRIRNFPPVPLAIGVYIAIAGSIVPLSDSIVTLGVTLDSNLSFRHHMFPRFAGLIAHFHLGALRHIRAALTDDMAKTVAVSLIHSRIDYANSLIHISINLRRLQCVQNSAGLY